MTNFIVLPIMRGDKTEPRAFNVDTIKAFGPHQGGSAIIVGETTHYIRMTATNLMQELRKISVGVSEADPSCTFDGT